MKNCIYVVIICSVLLAAALIFGGCGNDVEAEVLGAVETAEPELSDYATDEQSLETQAQEAARRPRRELYELPRKDRPDTSGQDAPEQNALELPEPPTESFDAVPASQRVILNGEPFVLDGLEINGQMYFCMSEVARMLRGTRARFNFTAAEYWPETWWSPGGYRMPIYRWREPHGRQPHFEASVSESGIATVVRIGLWFDMMRDKWISEIGAMQVNGTFYFSLSGLSYTHAYFYHIENGVVYIDTMEPNISEYGFIVARDFLSARPTLFASEWTDEIRNATPSYRRDWWWGGGFDNFPFSFRLYDFNNDGIPEILIWYDFVEYGMWGIHVLYVYENGAFSRVNRTANFETLSPWGEIPYRGELFTDGHGNFYSLGGTHQEGFVRINHYIFTDDGVVWEKIVDIGYWIEDEQSPYFEQWAAVWREVSFSPPSFRGVPLTVVRPIEIPGLFEAAAERSIVR